MLTPGLQGKLKTRYALSLITGTNGASGEQALVGRQGLEHAVDVVVDVVEME